MVRLSSFSRSSKGTAPVSWHCVTTSQEREEREEREEGRASERTKKRNEH